MMLSDKVAYLKGLMEGLDIDSSTKEGKVLKIMAEILEDMAGAVEDIAHEVNEVVELVDIIDKDLGDVEEDIYDFDDTKTSNKISDIEDFDYDYDYDPIGGPIDSEDEDLFDDDFEAEDETEAEDEDAEDDEQMYECSCTNCGDTIYISESIVKEGSMRCPNCNTLLEFNYLEDDEDTH